MKRRKSRAQSLGLGRLSAVVVAGLLLNALPSVPANAANTPLGIWLDHTKRGAVEIYECGQSLCGRIIWMKQPMKSSGQPFRDQLNPDAKMRKRTICGLKIVGKLRQTGQSTWAGGWIYDPERGKAFDLQVKVHGANRLTITGYRISPAFGKSFRWVRAPEDIGRCAPKVEAALNEQS